MEADLLRRFLHRTRQWSRAPRGLQLFALAAEALQEFAEADSGFFIYHKQIFRDKSIKRPQVYLPWGVFTEDTDILQDVIDQMVPHIEVLEPAFEKWILAEDIPLLSLRPDLANYGLLEIGIWPITSRERMMGSIVVVRTKRVSNWITPQMSTAIMDACAAQVSVAIDLILALRLAEEASQKDLLTGLLNRRGLENHLSVVVLEANQAGQEVIFGILDVDDLKKVNDSLGHPAGDELLRRLSDTIRQEVRKGDVACRYGGDEFVVVLQSNAPSYAPLERLQRAIEQSGCSVSVGAAIWGTDGETLEECYHVADARLYESKRSRGFLRGSSSDTILS